ncbi:MAG: hypothetical protein IJC30_01880 [Alphaproteobacteria bacterium]|nr:hypothetical protein [Alphaproteobacteria bacterium]
MMSEFQLLYTRISHDLAGISGAVYNGVELLSESPEYLDEALPVLTESTQDLIARLRFFRQTFGLPAEKTEDATALYLKTLSNPIELQGTCETQIQKMLALTLSDVMIRGGHIQVKENELIGKTQRFSESVSLLNDVFSGKTDGLSEKNIPARIAYLCAEKEKKSIRIALDTDKVTLSVLSKD